jgi:AbrB family looped-hinge helix DNA binding protein
MLSKIIKVSDKGQIAIPVEIRRSANISTGDSLLLLQKGRKILMEKPRMDEDFSGFLSEKVMKDMWDNEYDEVWNDL